MRFNTELLEFEVSVDQTELMAVFVQLLRVRYLICLPTYLSTIPLPRACSFQNQLFLSVSCIAACGITVSKAQAEDGLKPCWALVDRT